MSTRAHLLLEDLAVGGRLAVGAAGGHHVPLVDHDDDAAAALVGVAADGGVGAGDAFGGVDDQQRHVGGFEVAAGHDDAELLGHQVGLALAADAGGVDKAQLLALELDDLVDRVAGGAGDGRDDGAGGSGEGVEQRGFADVGAADDGDRGFVLLELAVGAVQRTASSASSGSTSPSATVGEFDRSSAPDSASASADRLPVSAAGRGDRRGDGVEQVADAQAVLGADGKDVADAQLAEVFGGRGHGLALDLVDGQKDGLAAADQHATRS